MTNLPFHRLGCSAQLLSLDILPILLNRSGRRRIFTKMNAMMRIISKLKTSLYRSGRSPDWIKTKNPESAAAKREAEEEWR